MDVVINLLDAATVVARPVVLGLLVVVAVLCALDWAVRTRRISPFSGIARFTRRAVDPVIDPIERRIVRAGGMPSSAPWWTLVAAVLGGLALLAFLSFLRESLLDMHYSISRGPRGILRLVVGWAFAVLQLAILVRVITSWVGGTYSWIGRVAHRLTEWFLRPMRRIIPTFGGIDVTPLLAWFLLNVIGDFVLNAM
jgi:YggT family protein